MRIAIIGPGIMTIPPKSWGAVEIIIWSHKQYLEKLGHTVDIFNTSNLKEVAEQINKTDYDFIHLQYDVYAPYFVEHINKPFCLTSHYGWLPFENTWSKEYEKLYEASLKAPGLIVLSKEIENVYRKSGYKGFIRILKNGVETKEFDFKEKGNGKAICVGNIQPRKRQALLENLVNGKVNLDFVGPNFEGGKNKNANDISYLSDGEIDFASADLEPDFKETETCKYLGIWSRDKVYKHLTDYSCLVLISEAEADPLVVKEALAAGLSVVVSKQSSANLSKNPFIHVLTDEEYTNDKLSEIINLSIKNNDKYRKKIRQYALDKFDYSVIIKEYIKIMEEFKK